MTVVRLFRSWNPTENCASLKSLGLKCENLCEWSLVYLSCGARNLERILKIQAIHLAHMTKWGGPVTFYDPFSLSNHQQRQIRIKDRFVLVSRHKKPFGKTEAHRKRIMNSRSNENCVTFRSDSWHPWHCAVPHANALTWNIEFQTRKNGLPIYNRHFTRVALSVLDIYCTCAKVQVCCFSFWWSSGIVIHYISFSFSHFLILSLSLRSTFRFFLLYIRCVELGIPFGSKNVQFAPWFFLFVRSSSACVYIPKPIFLLYSRQNWISCYCCVRVVFFCSRPP